MSAFQSLRFIGDRQTVSTLKQSALKLVAGCVLAIGCTLPAQADVAVGDRPEFIVRSIDNQTIRSADLQGHITVIDFWATWCPPCVASMPELKEHYERYHEANGVIFLGISRDYEAADLRDFVREESLPWPNVMDREAGTGTPMAEMFGVNGIPHVVIMNPEGVVVWVGHPALIEEPLANAIALYPYTPPAEEAEAGELAEAGAASPMDAQQIAVRRGLTDKLELASMYASSEQHVNAWQQAYEVMNHPAAADHLELVAQATTLAESLEQHETHGREITAHRLVTEAEALIEQEEFDAARVPLREVVIDYVDTAAAERAADLLGKI